MFLPDLCSFTKMQKGGQLLSGGSTPASTPYSLWKYVFQSKNVISSSNFSLLEHMLGLTKQPINALGMVLVQPWEKMQN